MTNKPIPYIYTIEKNKKVLIYYGADHSFDVGHRQWEDIRKHFNIFIEKTGGKDCVVFVEGGGTDLKESEEVAINEGGEPLFMTFIASKVGIKTESPEPDESYEINELLKLFSKEEIMHYYFTRLVDQWNRYKKPRPEFEIYMEKFLNRYKLITGWDEFEFTVNNMKSVHQKLSGKKFEDTDDGQIYQMTWPMKYEWVSNKVAEVSSKIRNDYISSVIKKYWDADKNIFIVYGQGHAVEQEEFLRTNLM